MTTELTYASAQASSDANQQALEFFATSLAALASSATSPKEVLEDALTYFVLDGEALLSNKAKEAGYQDFQTFQNDLLCMIGRQLQGLQDCHLTAAERAQKRLIQAL